MIELKTEGPTRCVDEHTLGSLTAMGWRLLAVVTTDVVETIEGARDYNTNLKAPDVHEKLTVTRYLVTKDESSAALHDRVALAETVANELEGRLRDTTKQLSELEATNAKLERQIRAERDSVKTLGERQVELASASRRMESELGAARDFFGKEAWARFQKSEADRG